MAADSCAQKLLNFLQDAFSLQLYSVPTESATALNSTRWHFSEYMVEQVFLFFSLLQTISDTEPRAIANECTVHSPVSVGLFP